MLRIQAGAGVRHKWKWKGNSMQVYWWFLLPAILLTLFSDPITRAVKADQTLRTVILIFCGGVILVCIVAMIASHLA